MYISVSFCFKGVKTTSSIIKLSTEKNPNKHKISSSLTLCPSKCGRNQPVYSKHTEEIADQQHNFQPHQKSSLDFQRLSQCSHPTIWIRSNYFKTIWQKKCSMNFSTFLYFKFTRLFTVLFTLGSKLLPLYFFTAENNLWKSPLKVSIASDSG